MDETDKIAIAFGILAASIHIILILEGVIPLWTVFIVILALVTIAGTLFIAEIVEDESIDAWENNHHRIPNNDLRYLYGKGKWINK